MAQLIADRRDIDFVLYEQLEIEQLIKAKEYREFNRKMFDMVISEARNFGIKEILPTFKEGDREGARFENGIVKVPECFHRPHKLFVEGEWTAITEDPELGGQGFPHIIALATTEYLVGSNFSFTAYIMLGHSAGRIIEYFGTEKEKKLFLQKLYTGRWGGTMLLTEPQAGSDVGALTTTAVKNQDGTYSISGNKIFITSGEHDLTENIIHPVLARIEGAPKGSKGISIFIVPKIWVNDDGSLGNPNDVVCTGIEEKMGIHGSATCSMALGGKGNCRGFLLGEENKGMHIMFHMVNQVRLEVGFQGLSHASAAYLYALNYARERLQGTDLEKSKDPEAPQVPIIRHPDVRRMLLWMKSYVDGMRSFIYYVVLCVDKEICAETDEDKEFYKDLIELLTPIVKAYCTERGFEVCSTAVQVYGGYGYTKEYPVEQLLRDSRIASIYEGTNGIQAMDLLGRKLGMKNGAIFMNLLQEIGKITSQAKATKGIEELADKMEEATNRLGDIAIHMGKTALSPDFKTAFAFAHPFMEVTGDCIMAWMLLWRSVIAAPKLEKLFGNADKDGRRKIIQKNKNAAFYDGQIKTASYYINSIIPITLGKMDAIKNTNDAGIKMAEKSFGG